MGQCYDVRLKVSITDEQGITSDKASRCIQFYNEILRKADEILHPMPKVAENEDLPA